MTFRIRSRILVGMLLWGLAVGPAAAAGEPPAPALDLKEALRLAWKANPNLQVSRLQELIAGEDVVRARSGFLPQVKSEASQTIYDDPVKFRIGGAPAGPTGPARTVTFPMTNRNFWSTKIEVDQTIFDFWATPARYQGAILGKQASVLDTAQTRDNIFLTVAQGYFRVLRSEKLVKVAEQEVAQLRDHLKIAQDQYEFGVATYNDVLQADVSLADSRARLITAKNDVVNIRSALNKVLALPIAAPTVLKEEQGITLPEGDLTRATDVALKNRSDLKASERRVAQQEQVVTQTRAQYFPRIFAQAGQNYVENDLYLHGTQYYLILAMQWNMFSGLDTKAQVSQAKDRVAQLRVQHQDLGEQVRLDVQNAYLSVRETGERVKVTEKAVNQGEENMRLNEERYKEQVGTATDVIDAQTLLTRTRVNYFTSLYDHQMAKAQMMWAIGAINDLMPQGKPDHAP